MASSFLRCIVSKTVSANPFAQFMQGVLCVMYKDAPLNLCVCTKFAGL